MTNASIRTLREADIPFLHHAFVAAFSTYSVKIDLTFEAFRIRLQKLHCSFENSVVAVTRDNKIVGFILHSMINRNSSAMLYNGGTGVIPEYRGNRLATRMYNMFFGQIHQYKQVSKILLEVITTNEAALKLYKGIGFKIKQPVKCFKLKKRLDSKIPSQFRRAYPDLFEPLRYQQFWDFEPTIADSNGQILHNLINETIIEVIKDKECCGYIVFQPYSGRISQLAVAQDYRNQGIGTFLLSEAVRLSQNRKLTVMNIPDTQDSTIGFLEGMGFENQVNQFEMELSI